MQSWNEQQASWDKLTLTVSGASEVCFAPSWGLTTLSSWADAAVKDALLSDGGNREIINCYSPVRIYVLACMYIYICVALCVCLGVCLCIRLQSQCLWWQGNETLCLKALWVNQRNLALIHPKWQWCHMRQWLTDIKKGTHTHTSTTVFIHTNTHIHTQTMWERYFLITVKSFYLSSRNFGVSKAKETNTPGVCSWKATQIQLNGAPL